MNPHVTTIAASEVEEEIVTVCSTADMAILPQTDSQTEVEKQENSPPQVHKNLVNKNKEALEAIRKSLNNKLINPGPPARVAESIKASESKGDTANSSKPVLAKSLSISFEETRASIAEALEFNSHDKVARPSTKRQAPKPP